MSACYGVIMLMDNEMTASCTISIAFICFDPVLVNESRLAGEVRSNSIEQVRRIKG